MEGFDVKSFVQNLTNITNSEGEVITLFDGRVTLSQVIICVIACIVVYLAFRFLKGLMKALIVIGATCLCLVHFELASPEQLVDVAQIIGQRGVSTYEYFASASDNIKIEGDSIQLKLSNTWVDISEIKSFAQSEGDSVTVVTADGSSFAVQDSAMLELLKDLR